MNIYKKTILIDLDGVINTYTGNFNKNYIPNIKEGANDFLEKLSNKYELILFTTRNSELAQKWLVENKIDHYLEEITNIKKPAFIYVDDKALKFNGNYNQALDEIEKFEVYWKK
ncbi:hypothetical protein IJG14_01910 [bacterium]|nr:hypothetical protein [bacterium]